MNPDSLQKTSDAQKREKEKEKLSNAVDEFANDIKIRLFQQVDQGYRGWDNSNLKEKISFAMAQDAVELDSYIIEGEEPPNNLFVDVAARVMFLSRFYNEGDTK